MKASNLFLLFFLIHFAGVAQQLGKAVPTIKKDTTEKLWVNGVCEMCKDRIEQTLRIRGVLKATWDISSKELTVTYKPSSIGMNNIARRLADAGHDNQIKKAPDVAYKGLPACCKYRDLKKEPILSEEDIVSKAQELESKADSAASLTVDGNWIKGVVMDIDKKGRFQPLEGATVVWLGDKAGVLTDANGVFRLANKEGGKKLIVSYTGMIPDTMDVTNAKEMKIVLAEGNMLKAVEVTARQRTSLISNARIERTQIMTERELFKAACCNLSESFETNPTVDVANNDAMTGSKQIQLLGLSSSYSQLTIENMPGPRGIATALGLNYVPGAWIESIQITKGVGSVVNGYESISGQINVELKKPEKTEPLFLSLNVNEFGKTDLNLSMVQKLSPKWSTGLLMHNDYLNKIVDMNMDMFRDMPTGSTFTILNRWKYDDSKGMQMQMGFKILQDYKVSGQTDFSPQRDKFTQHMYGVGIDNDRREGFAKIGYVFPEKKYKSLGLQLSAFDHTQDAYYGWLDYKSRQQNVYANFIYQSIIKSTEHKFRTGFSFQNDIYTEKYNYNNRFANISYDYIFDRKEAVPGVFFEYTYTYLDKFNLVAGVRADNNSMYGSFITPRLHMKYSPNKNTAIRIAVGRGQRTANILAENMSVFASSRKLEVIQADAGKAYGLDQEMAWNKGISIDQNFYLFNRNAHASLEFFRTDFQQQVIMDLENVRKVSFYNLNGKSYSNSFMAQVDAEVADHLDVRLAYRYHDVKSTYGGVLLQKPLIASDRAFVNLAYEFRKWNFDVTGNWVGSKRIPPTSANPMQYQFPAISDPYTTVNLQLSRTLGKKDEFDLYAGAENLTNFYQRNSVVAEMTPFSVYFDASLIWGPLYGRMVYGGLRYHIK